MKVIAFDTETFRFGPGNLSPKIVCGSFATREKDSVKKRLVGNHPDDNLETILHGMLTDPNTIVVTHGGGYDYACVMASYPNLIPFVFDALESGRLTDTLWREKLLNLSTSGRLEQLAMPDGSMAQVAYGLADLEFQYLALDRRGEKKDEEEGWRANYSVLDGWHAEEYPEDAVQYALEDAEGTLLVYEEQDIRGCTTPWNSMQTQQFQLAASHALYLMSSWGMATDQAAVEAMDKEVRKRLDANEALLIEKGILSPAVPSAPYKSQQKRVAALEEAGIVGEDALRQNGVKFTEAKPSKRNMKVLQAFIADLFQQIGKEPEMTEGGEREPQIKLDGEVQEMLAQHSPVMVQYMNREALSKLVGQQLPTLRGAAIVHPKYDTLKETGRTSSYGNAKGKPAAYPAVHIQGVPNEIDGIDPRQCYVPRPGRVFFDCDYTALELACTGQITYSLFGHSVHLDRYNAGVDLHAYLGSQLAVMSGAEGLAREFTQGCRSEGILSDPLAVYAAFMECKTSDKAPVKAFYKEWRNFAKPVGLGFPGGLGAETMVEFARKTYKVNITVEQATDFRDMWRTVYPEMVEFFEWVNEQTDDYNEGGRDEDGRQNQLYWYETPLGMIRRGASFCAAANGKCMQSPGAEGAKAAMIRLARLCYDETQKSILFGCRPIAFIHDQVIGETTEDESLWHDQCIAVRDVMCNSMQIVLPDIKMRSDESHLTRVWSKKSVPMFGTDGKLIPWAPTKAA